VSSSDEWVTLSESLRRLEQEDPEVAEASRRLDDTVDSIVYRAKSGIPKATFHKSKKCPSCGGRAPWDTDAWTCLDCGDEWYPDHFGEPHSS
jgi:hypothetical protein